VNAQENWARLKSLFARSLDQPDEEREAWLDRNSDDEPELRAELRRLLAQQRRPAPVFSADAADLLGKLIPEDDDTADALLGKNVGAYRLTRLLGEGGMGRVYLAERADGQFSQQVALKLIRAEFATAELHQRFLRERDTLARLTHPNIAQLHDGGVTDAGAPYFTLEFIEGDPITRWCDEQALDIRGRLKLMMKVCDAVQYAHRNLIVHRDLKPSNILVTADGEPKLLDFGIAKPLANTAAGDELTNTQATPMTREYAAPEQVLGDPITIATDVYALGVLLYLLLCGQMPYRRAALGQISWTKAILEEMPEPLERAVGRDVGKGDAASVASSRSTSAPALKRTLRGDLEHVVQRALAKSPESRYATVSAMANDLRAFLDGRPVSGGTRTYKMRKFVRRHWLPMSVGTIAILAVLGGAAGIAWEARQREHEAERALREEHTTKAVKDFLFGLFTAVDPHEAKGRDITARELLDRGAQRIELNMPEQPALKAELQSVLGRIYYQLGLYAPAGELQKHAIDTLKVSGDEPLLLARSEIDRANTLSDTGDLAAATMLANDALDRLRTLPGSSPNDRVRALYALGSIAVNKRDFAEAKRQADAALEIAHDASIDDELLGYTLLQSGNANWGLHQLDAAEANYRQLLAQAVRTQGSEGLMVATAHINLGIIFASRSLYAQAIEETQKALDIDLKVRGPQHSKVADERAAIGQYYSHQGHYRRARELLEQVVAWQRANLAADNPAVAGTLINLGTALVEIPDVDAAKHAFAEAQQIWQAKYGPEFMGVQVAKADLAYVYRLKGELGRAEAGLLEMKQFEEKHGQGDDPELYYQLGELRRLQGNLQDAVKLNQQAVQFAHSAPGESSEAAALAHHYLGLALRDSGDLAGAERELRAALASFGGYLPKAEHPLAATTRLELGLLLAAHADTRAESVRLLSEAVAIREQFLGVDDLRARQAQAELIRLQEPH
jgi:eukaryotic-like serine/threonine-protein kinase